MNKEHWTVFSLNMTTSLLNWGTCNKFKIFSKYIHYKNYKLVQILNVLAFRFQGSMGKCF